MTKPVKWEYMHDWFEYQDLEDRLSEHGNEGWELVNFVQRGIEYEFIFKRPKTDENN